VAIRFSISSMLQLTACMAVLLALYGFLPTFRGFKPGFVIERQIFTLCLAGALFPSLIISLCRLPVTSWFCWQSILISTIVSSWMGFFLVHRWWTHNWQSLSSQSMAGVLLLLFAVISSLIIASFTAVLTTSIQRNRLPLSGRTTRKRVGT